MVFRPAMRTETRPTRQNDLIKVSEDVTLEPRVTVTVRKNTPIIK